MFIISHHDAATLCRVIDKTTQFINITDQGEIICPEFDKKSVHIITTAHTIEAGKGFAVANPLAFVRQLKKACAIDKKANIAFERIQPTDETGAIIFGKEDHIIFTNQSIKNTNPVRSHSTEVRTLSTFNFVEPDHQSLVFEMEISATVFKGLEDSFTIEVGEKVVITDGDTIATYSDSETSFRGEISLNSMKKLRTAVGKDDVIKLCVYSKNNETIARLEYNSHRMFNACDITTEETIKVDEWRRYAHSIKGYQVRETYSNGGYSVVSHSDDSRVKAMSGHYSAVAAPSKALQEKWKQEELEAQTPFDHISDDDLETLYDNTEAETEVIDYETGEVIKIEPESAQSDLSCIGIQSTVVDLEKQKQQFEEARSANKSLIAMAVSRGLKAA